jgi:hypothetical protein
MANHTSIRECMRAELSWSEPAGQPPERRVWQNSPQREAISPRENTAEFCRDLCGFVCLKF